MNDKFKFRCGVTVPYYRNEEGDEAEILILFEPGSIENGDLLR